MGDFGLSSRYISSVGEARRVFGETKGLMIARPGSTYNPFYFCVPEGFFAVVTRWGKVMEYTGGKDEYNNTPIWPPGPYWFHGPWYQVSFLVSKQAIVYDAPCRGVVTRDNVQIQIDIVVVFRVNPENKQKILDVALKLSPQDFQLRLQAQVDQSIKSMARDMLHSEVYGLRSSGATTSGGGEVAGTEEEKADMDGAAAAQQKGAMATSSMVRTLNQAFKRDGIEVQEVIVVSVKLPKAIEQQISNKTKASSANKEAKMNQKRSMVNVSNHEEKETLRQKVEEDVMRVKQQGEREINETQNKLNQLKADVQKNLDTIRQEGDNQVRLTQAEALKQVTISKQTQQKTIAMFHAEADAEARQIDAETEVQLRTIRAQAQLHVDRQTSEADKRLSEAEGTSAPMVAAARHFKLEQAKLKTLASLGKNKELVIVPSGGSDVGSLLVADQIMKKQTTETRSSVLAQMIVTRKASTELMDKGPAPEEA